MSPSCLGGDTVNAYLVPVQPGPFAGPSACIESTDLSSPSSAPGSIGTLPLKPSVIQGNPKIGTPAVPDGRGGGIRPSNQVLPCPRNPGFPENLAYVCPPTKRTWVRTFWPATSSSSPSPCLGSKTPVICACPGHENPEPQMAGAVWVTVKLKLSAEVFAAAAVTAASADGASAT